MLDGGESLGRVLFFRTNKPAVSKVRRHAIALLFSGVDKQMMEREEWILLVALRGPSLHLLVRFNGGESEKRSVNHRP
jgi:hypothetical protein